MTIRGKDKTNGCILNEALHQDILDRAVQLAIASKSITSASNKD